MNDIMISDCDTVRLFIGLGYLKKKMVSVIVYFLKSYEFTFFLVKIRLSGKISLHNSRTLFNCAMFEFQGPKSLGATSSPKRGGVLYGLFLLSWSAFLVLAETNS